MPHFMDSHKVLRFPIYDILIIFVLLLQLTFPPRTIFCSAYSALTAEAECNFPAIFNFGDSNSDTGGLAALSGQPPPPYGETYFHTPSGRYSDGRLILDFMAKTLGLPYLSAYLDSVGSNFSHGTNFATVGSTIAPILQNGYSPISLENQITQYSNFHLSSQIVRKQGGDFERSMLPEENHFKRALYTIDIGQNDLTAAYARNMSTKQVQELLVPDLLDHFSRVVKKIYGEGGRSFWVHNTGPVGCYPYVMSGLTITAAEVDEYGCASPYNDVAQYFNLGLKKTVFKLREDLPSAAITYVDIYSAKYSLITRAKQLGFEKPFVACCGHGGKLNFNVHMQCGRKKVVKEKVIAEAKSCKDPTTRISWDGIHFTEAANKWIFHLILNGSFSNPPHLPFIHACRSMPPPA